VSVKTNILKLFAVNNELTVKEIVYKLDVSKQMVHLVLTRLLEDNIVQKFGRTPKTIYRILKENNLVKEDEVEYISASSETHFMNRNFLLVTETGNLLQGIQAFSAWCKVRNLPVQKTLNEFIDTKKKYANYYDKVGIIDGTEKLNTTKGYEKIFLNKLFYLDFYAIERFGKTRLGTLLHYAKQGQSKFLMRILVNEISKRIKEFIKLHKVDAVVFVPPTIRRELQLMKYKRN